jgi:hypothetical protein
MAEPGQSSRTEFVGKAWSKDEMTEAKGIGCAAVVGRKLESSRDLDFLVASGDTKREQASAVGLSIG